MADEEYVHQSYPKWLYGPNNLTVLVETEEEHIAINGDWYDSPADVPVPSAEPLPVEGEADVSAAADEDHGSSPRRRH